MKHITARSILIIAIGIILTSLASGGVLDFLNKKKVEGTWYIGKVAFTFKKDIILVGVNVWATYSFIDNSNIRIKRNIAADYTNFGDGDVDYTPAQTIDLVFYFVVSSSEMIWYASEKSSKPLMYFTKEPH